MTSPPEQRSPLALAMEWVSRIFVVGLEMVLPGLGGGWLDERWNSKPVFALIGFGLGIVGGMAHLLLMTAADSRRNKLRGASGVSRGSKSVSESRQRKNGDPPRDEST